MSPVLLQLQVQLPHHNPIVVISIIVGIIIALAFLLFNANRNNATRRRRSAGPQKFSRRRFRHLAQNRGLNAVQAKTLENLALKYRPSAPMSIFTNGQVLDIMLQKAISEIRHQNQAESVKEAHINSIYRIKQAIERNRGQHQTVQSSTELHSGQQLSITAGGTRYLTRVTGKLRSALAAEIPHDESGGQVRWKKLTPVHVFVPRSGGKGFSFQSKVVGYSAIKGRGSVLLQHSNAVAAAAQRRYRRKELGRPAYFFAIRIMTVGSGRNAKRQAVPQTKGALGTVLDVSAGGCAVKSTFPLPKGTLVKLEFETMRLHQVTVYGKVQQVRKAEPMGGVMHIMFTRISRKNLNSINSYVYDMG